MDTVNRRWPIQVGPGLALCSLIALAAHAAEALQRALIGRAWVDALVLAILIGAAVRSTWAVHPRFQEGIDFAAKPVLEAAIVLLGLTLDVPLLLRTGPILLAAVVIAVMAALGAAYALGRVLGLERRLAALVAVGNAICGNSAIAAAAPVIDAQPEDVAAAIAFTAVLGVGVVLMLPLAGAALALDDYRYGVVSGLTVYAVPQVLAATLPVSSLSGDVGTLVKLTRVLLLGPVLIGLAVWARLSLGRPGGAARRPAVVPWFIAGFLLLACVRGLGAVPEAVITPARETAKILTIVALAALGLGVDIRALRQVGPRVAAAAAGGLALLFAVAILLVRSVVHPG